MTTLLISVIYLSFIGLGLPDSMLGAAWPIMSEELASPIFGLIAQGVAISLFPYYMLFVILMLVTTETVNKISSKNE